MKKFKEFKSEQQYVTEIGPIAATLMGAMALWGGYQAFKKIKSKWKGYKESKKEKKENAKDGYEMELKTLNPDTGKDEYKSYFIDPSKKPPNPDLDKMGVKLPANYKSPNDEDILKIEKEAQKGVTKFGKKIKGMKHRGDDFDDLLPDTMLPPPEDAPEPETTAPSDGQPGDDELSDEEKLRKKGEAGEIEDEGEAMDYFKLVKKAPTGWENKGDQDNPELVKKENESYMLKFGEFIAEDIMKDLKKASKSKKDTEITLDDGTDIPIDPITADIFVKYIEGFSSSEKNKTIKQIQRTERGFMKVLGKAHEG